MNRKETIQAFRLHLVEAENSPATCRQYAREAEVFLQFLAGKELTRESVLAYKETLVATYQASSVNTKIAALNRYFSYLERSELRLKPLRIQRTPFRARERELTKGEYLKLLEAATARKDERISLLLQTLGGTGIRVSELQYITAEAVASGEAAVRLKGKTRIILLPKKLRRALQSYIRKHNIRSGAVFVTVSGKPMDRSNIWKLLKALSQAAGVEATKVFPHNLRKLFASRFYQMDKDIAKLADLLGHSSINTTRIYLMSSGQEHRRRIDALGLVL